MNGGRRAGRGLITAATLGLALLSSPALAQDHWSSPDAWRSFQWGQIESKPLWRDTTEGENGERRKSGVRAGDQTYDMLITVTKANPSQVAVLLRGSGDAPGACRASRAWLGRAFGQPVRRAELVRNFGFDATFQLEQWDLGSTIATFECEVETEMVLIRFEPAVHARILSTPIPVSCEVDGKRLELYFDDYYGDVLDGARKPVGRKSLNAAGATFRLGSAPDTYRIDRQTGAIARQSNDGREVARGLCTATGQRRAF